MGYPDIGIYVCDCPSAGHDMVYLDYRKNGKDGEPEVVHIDQELDYSITFLAENFESFIRGLIHESVYDRFEEHLKNTLETIEKGKFSKLLLSMIQKETSTNFEKIIRTICKKLTLDKGCFAFHADELSYFWEIFFDKIFCIFRPRTSSNSLQTCLPDTPMLGFFSKSAIRLSSSALSSGDN
jgi:hypothetical protein